VAGTPNSRDDIGAPRSSFEPRHGEAPARWHVVRKPSPARGRQAEVKSQHAGTSQRYESTSLRAISAVGRPCASSPAAFHSLFPQRIQGRACLWLRVTSWRRHHGRECAAPFPQSLLENLGDLRARSRYGCGRCGGGSRVMAMITGEAVRNSGCGHAARARRTLIPVPEARRSPGASG
jgi:hypothetical protein